eukprot:6171957-Pleurochrysis_carterae.AAC.4
MAEECPCASDSAARSSKSAAEGTEEADLLASASNRALSARRGGNLITAQGKFLLKRGQADKSGGSQALSTSLGPRWCALWGSGRGGQRTAPARRAPPSARLLRPDPGEREKLICGRCPAWYRVYGEAAIASPSSCHHYGGKHWLRDCKKNAKKQAADNCALAAAKAKTPPGDDVAHADVFAQSGGAAVTFSSPSDGRVLCAREVALGNFIMPSYPRFRSKPQLLLGLQR